MSRAFAKEDDTGQPPIIPPRAALPPGTPNYVTPRGLELLRNELTELETELSRATTNRDDDAERSRQLSILNGRIAMLTERLGSAKLVDPRNQPADEVRFGATVTLKTLKGAKPGLLRKFTIVGADEADISKGLIAFVAPIARAVQGAKTGQKITLQLGPTKEEAEVTEIHYGTT